MMQRTININVVRHATTGMLVAISDDMRGLIVHARSKAELERRLPLAMTEMLEAEGYRVISITTTAEPDDVPVEFVSHRFRAAAEVERRAA